MRCLNLLFAATCLLGVSNAALAQDYPPPPGPSRSFVGEDYLTITKMPVCERHRRDGSPCQIGEGGEYRLCVEVADFCFWQREFRIVSDAVANCAKNGSHGVEIEKDVYVYYSPKCTWWTKQLPSR